LTLVGRPEINPGPVSTKPSVTVGPGSGAATLGHLTDLLGLPGSSEILAKLAELLQKPRC
jgi:hypothetical protein